MADFHQTGVISTLHRLGRPDIDRLEREILSYSGGAWVCTSFQTLLDSDSDGSMAWNDCDDNDAGLLDQSLDNDCDGVLTASDCDDNDDTSTVVVNDGDCEGVVTALDCDDNDDN